MMLAIISFTAPRTIPLRPESWSSDSLKCIASSKVIWGGRVGTSGSVTASPIVLVLVVVLVLDLFAPRAVTIRLVLSITAFSITRPAITFIDYRQARGGETHHHCCPRSVPKED